MRWVFLLDVFIALLWVSCVILPQVVSGPQSPYTDFRPMDLLTGESSLNNSIAFYAGYQPYLPSPPYDMALAYVLVIGAMYMVRHAPQPRRGSVPPRSSGALSV